MTNHIEYNLDYRTENQLITDLAKIWVQSIPFFSYQKDILEVLKNHSGHYFMIPAKKSSAGQNTYFHFSAEEKTAKENGLVYGPTLVTYVYTGYDFCQGT